MLEDQEPVIAGIADPIYVRVREQLRTDILAGVFAPGERIKIITLSKRYGVSQMPVREALQMLQGEGLVTIAPNKGASIRAVDERFIRNMYDIRGALETLLVRRCVARIQDAEIFSLHSIQARYEDCAREGDAAGLLRENKRLHHIIYAAADNSEALEMLERHWGLIDSLRRTFGFGEGRTEELIAEHRQLIRALDRRDTAEAERISMAHCDNARDDLIVQRDKALSRQDQKTRKIR
jgi:DNA-binding GntR family transcriptional regulator